MLHSTQHANANDAIEALEAKLGIDSSTAVANSFLVGTGAGASSWSTTPTLGSTSWTNLNHAHAAANSGGQISAGNLSGATLTAGVTASSLTSVGTLTGLTCSGVVNLADGTAALPSITFTGDTDTGFYRAAANSFDATAYGATVVRFSGVLNGQNALTVINSAGTDNIILNTTNSTGANVGITITPKGSAGVTITSGGIAVTGNSTITGTLGGLTGLTVASGAATIGTSTTSQLIIDQSTADGEILTLRSSTDVAHGMTDITTTETYARFLKSSALGAGLGGGLTIMGLAGGAQEIGINLWGIATTDDTGKSTAANGYVQLMASKKNGTTYAAAGADANLVVISTGGLARFLFDAEGSGHQDVGTAWTEYEDHDDMAVLTSLSHHLARPGNAIGQEFGRWLSYNRRDLEALKLVSFNDGPGQDRRPFVNMSKLTMLHGGAIRQAFARIEDVGAALEERTGQLTAALTRLAAVEQRLARPGGAA